MSKSRKRKLNAPVPTPPPSSQEKSELHQPIKPSQAQQSTLRAKIDRALPPFTVQRYVAIWALGMIPLVGLLLILLRPWDARPSPAKVGPGSTSTVTKQGSPPLSTPGTPGTPLATAAPAISHTLTITTTQLSISDTVGMAQTSKYLVVETLKGRIVARLHTTPTMGVVRTVANFSERTNSGVLDGSAFFRVESWLVQGGGDPDTTSRLPAEYNKAPFVAGSVALAHGADPSYNSDSQFLIAKTDAPQLDGQYTNIGQVTQGMDVVNKLVAGDKMLKVRVMDGGP